MWCRGLRYSEKQTLPLWCVVSLPYPQRQQQLARLVQKLGLPAPRQTQVRWDLLDLALTHASVSPTDNYEQLEFVGDAVVRLVTSEFLFEQFGELSVGDFTAIRSMLVSDRQLTQLGEHYNLERYLLVGDSSRNDTLGRASRLADACEAMLGAFYLSTHSFVLIRPWLDPWLSRKVQEIRQDPAHQNYKAALQEWTQAHFKTLPEYRVTETKTLAAADRFWAEVWFQGQALGQGVGHSIKAAEQAAAQAAFLAVRDRDPATVSPSTGDR